MRNPVPCRGLNTMRKISLAVSLMMTVYFGVIQPPHYSEDSMWLAPLDDPALGGAYETWRHVIHEHFDEAKHMKLSQRERFDFIIGALNATIIALGKLGLEPFIDSGTLLGWYRHRGKPIPWDDDADVGLLGEECRRKFPTRESIETALTAVLDPTYLVRFFNCNTQPGQDPGFAGIITDRRNGFKVDVFIYDPIEVNAALYPWREGKAWLQRDFDFDRFKPHRVTPRNAIVPLQWGNFSGVTGNIIPNDPETVLKWDFGLILAPPIYPHRLAMHARMSPWSILVLSILMLGLTEVEVLMILTTLSMLYGGFSIIAIICLLFGTHARPGQIQDKILRLISIISLTCDLIFLLPQVVSTFMAFFSVPGFVLP